MALTTNATMPPSVLASLGNVLLATPTPTLIHRLGATNYSMPANGGTTYRLLMYNQLDAAVVPLGNAGITPPSQNLTNVHIDAELQFYGTWLEVNEQVTLTHQDPFLNAATIRLGENMRRSEDIIARDMLAATAAFVNCVGGANGKFVAVVKSSLIDLETEA